MKSLMKRLFLLGIVSILAFGTLAAAPVTKPKPPAIKMVIDADIGVDDAAAIAYLLNDPSKVQILGITAVAGNTTVENSATNALTLLQTAGRSDIPVVIGAAGPLVQAPSHQGLFVHGPDGLWFVGFQHPQDISGLSHDAAGFLCSHAQSGVTLLALGPLTNVANAVQTCPAQMKLYKIVWMGGADVVKDEGNTPVSVFNPWFDPDAAQIVLDAGVNMNMVTSDAARTVTVTTDMINKLNTRGTALGKLIAPALQQYASLFATAKSRHGKPRVALYDPAAAVIAVHPEWAISPQSALTTVQLPDGPARGQTIFAFTFAEHISVLASDAELSAIADQVFSDPNFDLNAALGAILARKPDNALVILDLDEKRVSDEWVAGVTH